jgi:hypothetical protein
MELVLEDNILWTAAVLFIAALPLLYAAIVAGKTANLVVAGFFVVCSLICIRKTRFVFDAQHMVVRWKSFVFLKTSTGSVPFDEITGIGIETSRGGSGGRTTTYRLTILTSKGAIPLASSYGADTDRYASMREKILVFLKPYAGKIASSPEIRSQGSLADVEPSILELLRQRRKVDAITLLRSMKIMSLSEAKLSVEEIESRMKADE